MFDIRKSLKPILPPSQHFAGLSEPLQRAITVVSSMVARAEQNGSMELNAKFSLQFVCVCVEERDRKYLVEGYLPTQP